MEVVSYSLICTEDLDIGPGTRQIRLADNSLATCHQVNLGSLCQLVTRTIAASNGASSLTLSGIIPAGARVIAVTTKVLTAFGTGSGLTGISIGDGTTVDKWANAAAITLNAETDQGDFTVSDWAVYPSGGAVVISAASGTFTSIGLLEVSVFFMLLSHRVAS